MKYLILMVDLFFYSSKKLHAKALMYDASIECGAICTKSKYSIRNTFRPEDSGVFG